MIASEERARALGAEPFARFAGSAVAGVDPRVMGIGPIPAVRKLLARTGVKASELDLVELNEAFASQSLAVVRELGLDEERVNVNGGAIALGHPLGMSGARLVVSLAHELRRRGGRYGLATLCVGVGQGQAALFERHRALMRTQVGDRRRRAGRPDAGAPAADRGHRGGRARGAQPRARRAAHPRGRARAGHGRPARRGRAWASACSARASSTTASSCSSTASATASRSATSPGGRSIVVYGQTEVVKDLIAARLASGAPLLFEVEDVSVHDLDERAPARSASEHEGREEVLECDVIAGCDGFHGVCRASIPERRCAPTRASTRSAGSASSPRSRRRATSSSTPTTSAASRCTACARPS